MIARKRLYQLIVLAAILLAALFLILGRDDTRREGEATIRIAPGTSTSEIARLLKDEDVISSEREFMKRAEETGVADRLKAGLYQFQRGESLDTILAVLESGRQAPEGVLSVPEGNTIEEIAAQLASKTDITENEYRQAAVPGQTLPLEGAESAENLEGFLFPSTYDLEPGITAKSIVGQQLQAFSDRATTLPWRNAGALGLSEYQALTVASMVEREARVPDERPLVAAVIYNRLKTGMRLEVDATVQYALGYWKEELTQQDLEIDSAYNTRLYAGLPPGPICNPGLDAMRAALEPAEVDYLFYVATGDEEGHHFFTSSYEEFLKAKQESNPRP